MTTSKLNVRTLLVSGSLALAGLLLASVEAQAQRTPGNNQRPHEIEVPGEGMLQATDITPFSLSLNFYSPQPRSKYSILISGKGQSGRIEKLTFPAPRKRGTKVLHRLLPDTEYKIAVQARTRRGNVLVAQGTAKTLKTRQTPSTDPCNTANITVRNISTKEADLSIESSCKFKDFEVRVTPIGTGGQTKVHVVKRTTSSKRAVYHMDGLSGDTRYNIQVRRIESSESAPLGRLVVFRTLK